jgi:hypothetical protein
MLTTMTGDDVNRVLDALPEPIMSWQRKVIAHVIAAATPEQLFYLAHPNDQMRLGLDYTSLMEHYAIERMRLDGIVD